MAGMQGFVKDRNADARTGSPHPDLNDLKTAVPNTKGDKKRKSKQNTSARREDDTSGRQHRPQHSTSARSSNSGIDDVSTTATTTRQRSGRDHHVKTRLNTNDRNGPNGEHHAGTFNGMHYDEGPENDQDLPQDPVDVNMERNFHDMLAETTGGNGSPTIAQTLIKGDSYPPTSVGAPSVTDQHDRNEMRTHGGGFQNMPSHAAERMNVGPRAYKQTRQPAVSRNQSAPASHAPPKFAAPQHQPQSMQPINPEPGSDFDVAAGFSFAPAPPVKKEIAVHASHPQSQAVQQQPVPAEIKAPAARLRNEPHSRAIHQSGSRANEHAVPSGREPLKTSRLQHTAEIHDHQGLHGMSDAQHHMTEQEPQSDAMIDEDPGEQFQHHEHEETVEDVLDYELSELYGKDYQSLKAEPFDQRPGTQPFIVSDVSKSATLTDKVAHLARAEPKTQANFFASLDIDEWEEAGDWFLDRFGDTIKRLKEVRREKRKAARAFEDEIEQRETAVNKKRELTSTAMSGMKSSGAAVLLGTPGKKQ